MVLQNALEHVQFVLQFPGVNEVEDGHPEEGVEHDSEMTGRTYIILQEGEDHVVVLALEGFTSHLREQIGSVVHELFSSRSHVKASLQLGFVGAGPASGRSITSVAVFDVVAGLVPKRAVLPRGAFIPRSSRIGAGPNAIVLFVSVFAETRDLVCNGGVEVIFGFGDDLVVESKEDKNSQLVDSLAYHVFEHLLVNNVVVTTMGVAFKETQFGGFGGQGQGGQGIHD